MANSIDFPHLPDRFNALVVGSGGIGQALSEALLATPACRHVALASRRKDPPPADSHHRIDYDDPSSVEALHAALAHACGRLHLVIICTGLLHQPPHGPEKSLDQLEPATLSRALAVNALGPTQLLKTLLPLLQHDEPSVIAAISARVGSIDDNRLGGWYSYRASKAALNQIWKTASIELGRRRRNPACVLLHPGTVDTPLSRPFQANVPAGRLFAPAKAADHLLSVLAGVTRDDNGRFIAWDGSDVPW